mgnify:CR=1 FL=1
MWGVERFNQDEQKEIKRKRKRERERERERKRERESRDREEYTAIGFIRMNRFQESRFLCDNPKKGNSMKEASGFVREERY